MKKILAVYNTCGISGRENLEDYINSIKLILDQDFDSFDLVVSSCLNEKATIDSLLEKFSGKIFVNFIKECHPVNVTFNHAVRRYIDKFGPCKSYLYVDSGTSFPQKTLFKDLNSYLETGKYGMITPQPENDTEYYNGLGVGRHDKDDEYAREILFKEGNYIIPIGKGMGTHTNLISEDLRSFYGNVYPDIFASHCTESTFSFFINTGHVQGPKKHEFQTKLDYQIGKNPLGCVVKAPISSPLFNNIAYTYVISTSDHLLLST